MSTLKVNSAQIGQSVTATNNFTWYQPSTPDGTVRLGNGNAGSVTDLVTVNSSGNVGIGTTSPAVPLQVAGEIRIYPTSGTGNLRFGSGGVEKGKLLVDSSSNMGFETAGTQRMTLDSSGNLGLGVTPSGWDSTYKAMQISRTSLSGVGTAGVFANNVYYSGGWKRIAATAAGSYVIDANTHAWNIAASGSADSAISFTQAMTLDASGRLLVAYTSTLDTANLSQISDSISFYGANSYAFTAANAAACCFKVGSQTTGRSINAKGTINASGADYAEYMTKAGDFEIAKGDVCGIDASGLLTNVFADAVSFVVKSTDPSYVGGDSWGSEIEDADALEIARQKVDRIAFAGQVPVNVLGAKSGDYIIPIADKKGIKGTAVASPTFEQYQIAVGKVIAIESDGRARIIVKVA